MTDILIVEDNEELVEEPRELFNLSKCCAMLNDARKGILTRNS